MMEIPYASAVGSLMYAMVCTRPDMVYAISLVNIFMGNPGAHHWKIVRHILMYLKGSTKVGLKYRQETHSSGGALGYFDIDFAGDRDKIMSSIEYVFTLFENIVSWNAPLQHVVALSSTEAKYIGVTNVIKEAL